MRREEKLCNWSKYSSKQPRNNSPSIQLNPIVCSWENKEKQRVFSRRRARSRSRTRPWESFGVKRWISIYLRQTEDWLQPGRESTKVISSGETIRLSEIGRAVGGAANSRRMDEAATEIRRLGPKGGGARIKTRLEGPRTAIVSLIVARRHRLPMCANKTPEANAPERKTSRERPLQR